MINKTTSEADEHQCATNVSTTAAATAATAASSTTTTTISNDKTTTTTTTTTTRRLDFTRCKKTCGGGGRTRRTMMRRTELQVLHQMYHRARNENHAGALLIEADSGTGKTALLDVFCSELMLLFEKENSTTKNEDGQVSEQENTQQSPKSSSSDDMNEDDETHTGIRTSGIRRRSSCSSSSSPSVICCRGKFEERTAASEPFAAIIEAMDALFEHLTTCSPSLAETWRERVEQELDTEIPLLAGIIPSIQTLFTPISSTNSNTETTAVAPSPSRSSFSAASVSTASSINFEGFANMMNKEWRFERFRFALRALIRCISTHAPLVLILDDLHWADPDSISLIQTLIQDSCPNRKFLLVAASRPMESRSSSSNSSDSDNNSRHKYLEKLKQSFGGGESEKLSIMTLEPLDTGDIAGFISELVDLPVENPATTDDDTSTDILAFARLLKQKSGGNAFVLVQFLRLLEEKRLIHYSVSDERWMWDLARIEAEASISDNVTQVVANKLQSLEPRRRSALMTAASLRVSHFDVKTIVHAMSAVSRSATEDTSTCSSTQALDESSSLRQHDSTNDDPLLVRKNIRELRNDLSDASEGGFVKEDSRCPGHFRFTHDRIREAAYSLLPNDRARRTMHLQIGRQLHFWMDQEAELGTSMSEEALLLHTTKQLNMAMDLIDDTWERLDLAELNYQAAEIAAKKASFFPSMEFLEQGIQCLGTNGWTEHYDLTLKMTVALTRMLYSCGLFEECLQMADSVIRHGTKFSEKRPVFHTKILCLMQQERQRDAVAVIHEVLTELEQPFPTRFLLFHVIRNMLKVKKSLKGMSDSDILGRPEVDDQALCDSAGFMERLGDATFLGADQMYLPLVVLRYMRLLLEQGRFPLAGLGLFVWGWIEIESGKLDECVRFGKLSMSLSGLGDSPTTAARLEAFYWSFTYHWKLPLRAGLKPQADAFREIWRYGGLDYYHLDANAIYRLRFSCGEPLRELATTYEKFAERLLDYKQTLNWSVNVPLLQTISNLLGESENPVILSGEHMDEVKITEEWKKSKNKAALYQVQLWGMLIAYLFHDDELAEKRLKQMKQDLFEDGPDILVPLRLFYSGLVHVARLRSTRRRRYRRRLRPILNQLRQWMEKGAVNCNHMQRILEAELLSTSFSASVDDVVKAYDDAIEATANIGLSHHEALANELAGDYLSGRDAANARPYVIRSLELYRQWEALAKVKDVERRHNATLLVATPISEEAPC